MNTTKTIKDAGMTIDKREQFYKQSVYNSQFIKDLDDMSSLKSSEKPTLSLKLNDISGIHGDRIRTKEDRH